MRLWRPQLSPRSSAQRRFARSHWLRADLVVARPPRKRSVWIWLPPLQQVLQCYDIPLAPDLNKARNVQTLPERRHKCSAPPSDELRKNPIIGIVWLLRPGWALDLILGRDVGQKSERHFDNTAWWFAVGWNSSQIGKLVKRDQSKLKENRFFVEYKKRNRSSVADVAAGTIARANTLNGLAWTLATWGLDITRTKDAAVEPEQACSKVMNVTDVPDNALDAAEQAVCIAKTLNEAGDTKGKYGLWLANFQDTRAYILMQTPGRMADAVDTYRKDVIPVLTSGEVLFRYAVAQLALGNKDGTAMADLRKSIAEQYFPSHELQHLNKYIEDLPDEMKDASRPRFTASSTSSGRHCRHGQIVRPHRARKALDQATPQVSTWCRTGWVGQSPASRRRWKRYRLPGRIQRPEQ